MSRIFKRLKVIPCHIDRLLMRAELLLIAPSMLFFVDAVKIVVLIVLRPVFPELTDSLGN